jgi:hypothetical protein
VATARSGTRFAPDGPPGRGRRDGFGSSWLGHDSASAIAQRLLERLESCATPDELPPELSSLAGRWAVVASLNGAVRLFHDAAGTRQLFYREPEDESDPVCWCASSADLLAEALELELAPDARELMESQDYKKMREYWWPGRRTPYRGVRLLLPNWCLDCRDVRALRYWGQAPACHLSLEEAATKAAHLLRGTMHAAALRGPLAASLTAGMDSRVTLAACRDIVQEIFPFSFVHAGIDPHHPDIRIPAKLLGKIGLSHHTLTCPPNADADFAAVYTRSNPTGTDSWAAVAQGFYGQLPQDLVRVTSVVSEVGRCFYQSALGEKRGPITATTLAELTRLGGSDFVLHAFDDWLAGVPEAFDGDVLDLFYWEQRLGSWAGGLFREWDIVHDGFSPFSCRELMTALVSVDEHHRYGTIPALHRKITELLWADLLEEPINPPVRVLWGKKARQLARRLLRR